MRLPVYLIVAPVIAGLLVLPALHRIVHAREGSAESPAAPRAPDIG